ncbi:MAG: hypothetical protein J7639_10595 [Paenibacillaceae bacterium]|nr:hypothetical protein [Paenibacillaceae bacterium]
MADGTTDRLLAGLMPQDQELTAYVKDASLQPVQNPIKPFVAKTIVDNKIIDDARIKYIMGELDEKGWNEAIQKWRISNGDKLINDYNEQYTKTK